MVVVGYTKDAYKVLNSWGPNTGDNGFVWIDKTWFHTFPDTGEMDSSGQLKFDQPGFLISAAVAKLPPSLSTINSKEDLVGVSTSVDCTKNPCEWYWEIGNYGEVTIDVSSGAHPTWVLTLFAYKSTNAKDIKTLVYEVFRKDGTNSSTYDGNGLYYGDWDISFPQGAVMYRDTSNPAYFVIPSDLNGKYYIALKVDSTSAIAENREDNNMVWTTDQPIEFVNGVAGEYGSYSAKSIQSGKIDIERIRSKNSNAYTPDELSLALNNRRNKIEASSRSMLKKPRNVVNTTKSLIPPRFK